MPGSWNIRTSDLPGYAPPPDWWHGPDMELFDIPNTPLAFVVYNQGEIGVATIAGSFALFRDREQPARLFAPRHWMVVAAPFSVRRAEGESLVLVYLANARDATEHYALIDLDARQFARLFIPNPLFHYTFTRLDAARKRRCAALSAQLSDRAIGVRLASLPPER